MNNVSIPSMGKRFNPEWRFQREYSNWHRPEREGVIASPDGEVGVTYNKDELFFGFNVFLS